MKYDPSFGLVQNERNINVLVIVALSVQSVRVCALTPYNLADLYISFEGTYSFLLQDQSCYE
jgi:hypothetical protein